MSVSVKMTGDERELVKAQERVEKGAAGITAEYRKLAKESLETQRYAKKAWEESLPPLVKYDQALAKLKGEYDKNQLSAEEYNAAVHKLQTTHLTTGATGTKAIRGLGAEFLNLLGPVTSVSGAIAAIGSGISTWVENTREISKVTQDAMKDVVAFAAMQEPGVGRQRAMRVLEASRGAATFGEAFDIAQGMQSAAGNFEKGLEVTKDILSAVRVGIPADLGREVATQAIAQKGDPGQWLRGIYAAGEVSLRDPKMIAPAAPAFQAFQDKTFAMAVAAQLAGTFGQELMPYTRQAGYGLGGVSPAAKWFQGQGLGPEATQKQRLEALAKASKDTIEELESIGFTEVRQAGAVQNLVNAFDAVVKYEDAIRKGIADVTLLPAKRRGIEAEFPEARTARLIAEEGSRIKEGRAFDDGAERMRLRELLIVSELQRRGIQQGMFGLNLYAGEGDQVALSPKAFGAQQAIEWLTPNSPYKPLTEAMIEANIRLDKLIGNTVRPPSKPIVPTPEQ